MSTETRNEPEAADVLSAKERAIYVFELSRPRFWFYLAGPVVVGLVYATPTIEGLLLTPMNYALFLYFLIPANLFIYGINDYFDSEIDEINPKKETKEVRYTDDKLVAALVVACGLLGLAFTPFLPLNALVWLGVFYVLSIGYSAPPMRFKTVPIADSVSNGLYIVTGVVAFLTLAPASELPVLGVIGAWLWTMGMHTFSAIPDIEPDREAGIRTTATWLGERRTYAYCFACWVAAAVAFSLVDVRLGAVLWLYPVFVAWVATGEVSVDRAYWWFPALNGAVGALLTMGGLWRIVPATEVLL